MKDIRVPNSEQCWRVLRATPGILRGLLGAAKREQLDWRPSAERWSITMVVAHLAQVEVKGFRERFQAMLAADGPELESYDQEALFRAEKQFDVYEEMTRFEEERGQTLAMLDKLPEGVGARGGRHAELGPITIAQLINEFAFHDLGHIRQVIELYRSCVFFPEMGAYQKYYRIAP